MPKLFSPLNINGLELKNRIVMSPMCMYMAETDGNVNDFHLLHYTTRAVGRVGLIITEATAISPEGRISVNDLGLWDDSQIEGHKKLTSSVHHYGSKIGVQLAHAGRKSTTPSEIIAPSAIPFDPNSKTPKEMTPEDIELIKTKFINGAIRAQEAGYDLVEVHGAHGYLLNEFLSPLTNKRSDEYGESPENRAKLLYEIVTGIKQAVSVPVLVRLSAMEYMDGGFNIGECVEVAKHLKALGVALIDVSSGGNQSDVDMRPYIKPLYQVHLSDRIRREAGIPVGAVGLITSPAEAEDILQDNRADLIFLGRELLRNPYFAMQAQVALEAKGKDIEKSYMRAFI